MGGSIESVTISSIATKKAFYVIYEETATSIDTLEAKTIGDGADYEEITMCAHDSLTEFTAFLVADPTLIYFLDYTNSAANVI